MEEEEQNPLLTEIRQGLTPNKSNAPTQSTDVSQAKEEMAKIIQELKKKMSEIDKITQELEQKRNQIEKNSPKKTERMLHEIRVPPLEMLK